MADKNIIITKRTSRPVEVEKTGKDVAAVWGKITGDINSQTDLKSALDEIRTLAYAGL